MLLTLLAKASVINEDKVILTVSLPRTSRANEHIRSWFCAGPAFDLCIFLADLGYALLLSYNKRERFFYWSLQHAAAIIIGEPQVVWFMVFNVNPWGSVRRDYIRYKTFCRIVLPHFSSNLQWASFIYLPALRHLNACLLKSPLNLVKVASENILTNDDVVEGESSLRTLCSSGQFLSWWDLADCHASSWHFSVDWCWARTDVLGRCWLTEILMELCGFVLVQSL